MITLQEIYNLTAQNAQLPDHYVVRTEFFNKLVELLNTDLIKVITGLRRTGKTFLFKLLYHHLRQNLNIPKENILFLNFEAPALYEYSNVVDLQHIYDTFAANADTKHKIYVFLDEIQNVTAWEKFVRHLYDTQKQQVQLFVTGSNSKLLSSEYSTAISGRVVELTVYPFKFTEVLQLIEQGESADNTDSGSGLSPQKQQFYLNQYLKWGGLPEVWLQPTESIKTAYITSLLNKIITDDIVNRYRIKNPQTLYKIALYIFNNTGNIFSITKLLGFLKSQKYEISRPTLEDYIQYLNNAFLITPIRNITVKSTKEIVFGRLKKFFTIDNAFITTTSLNIDSATTTLVENLTFNWLYQSINPSTYNLHFAYDTSERIDTDLVIMDQLGKIVLPINITFTLNDLQTIEREVTGLKRAIKYLNAPQGVLITWNRSHKKLTIPTNIYVLNLQDALITNSTKALGPLQRFME